MPDRRWLILRLEAPLIAFGGVSIDHIGPTRDFPARSMLAGLLANALGYQRTEWGKHQSLQDRLIFAARIDASSGIIIDTQNARLEKNDKGWTTRGVVEGRDGASYGAPHRRKRDYHMDARAIVALTLADDGAEPTLDQLAEALDRPARPLFFGRKPCLPAEPVLAPPGKTRFVNAPSGYAALELAPGVNGGRQKLPALWPRGEGPETGPMVSRMHALPDLRNWRTGLHGGARQIVEGFVILPEPTS